jgi:hypothetical protein
MLLLIAEPGEPKFGDIPRVYPGVQEHTYLANVLMSRDARGYLGSFLFIPYLWLGDECTE